MSVICCNEYKICYSKARLEEEQPRSLDGEGGNMISKVTVTTSPPQKTPGPGTRVLGWPRLDPIQVQYDNIIYM